MQHRVPLTVVIALAVATVLALTTATASASAPSLEEARRERAAVQQRLDDAAARLGDLEARAARLEDERADLAGRLAELEQTVGAARDRVAARVRELYKRGSADPMLVLLSGGDPDEAVARAATMSRLVSGDLTEVEMASNAGTQLSAIADRLAERERSLAATRADQRQLADSLQSDLERARSLESRLEREDRERRAEEARRAAEAARVAEAAKAAAARAAETPTRRPPAPPTSGGSSAGGSSSGGSASGGSGSSGGKVCPMGRPHSFTDTWGAPRSGGRSHRGTDILGPRGQDVYAIVSGVWDIKSYGRNAGNWAILMGSDGTHYWYLHLERHLVGDGARVQAGQLVATNGDTGNARGTTPHVHFEQHPGGGGAVNPYPLLRSLCG